MAENKKQMVGPDGMFLTITMFQGMIEDRFEEQKKPTLKQIAAAFGISVPNLSGMLKTGVMGANSRKKIDKAWKTWLSEQETAAAKSARKEPKLKFKAYAGNQIDLPLWKQMIATITGIKSDKNNYLTHELKQISNTFFDGVASTHTIRNFLSGEFALEKDLIAFAWNKWINSGDANPSPASPKPNLQMKMYSHAELTIPLFREMIATMLSIRAKNSGGNLYYTFSDRKIIMDKFDMKTLEWAEFADKGGTFWDLDHMKKVARIWNTWLESNHMATNKQEKKPSFGATPFSETPQMKKYTKDQITMPIFRGMVKAKTGIDLNHGATATIIKKISDKFDLYPGDVKKFIDTGEMGDYSLSVIALAWNRWIEINNHPKEKLVLKKYDVKNITRAVFDAMVKKRLGFAVTSSTASADLRKISDAFGGIFTQNVVDVLVHGDTIYGNIGEKIAKGWNEWIDGGMPSATKAEQVRLLNKHAGGNDGLVKSHYDEMQALARTIKQEKYRKSVFRGIKLRGQYEKRIIDVMANKSLKLSTLEGAGRWAESWSTEPKIAIDFAEGHGKESSFVVMEARPSPKDIIIRVDQSLMAAITDIPDYDKASIKSYVKEREIVVRTGNRKYTLCKNIRYMNIPVRYLRNDHGSHDINILIPIVKKIKDAKNLDRFQRDLTKGLGYFRFACGGGNLVYLASDRAASTWHRKLASR